MKHQAVFGSLAQIALATILPLSRIRYMKLDHTEKGPIQLLAACTIMLLSWTPKISFGTVSCYLQSFSH